MPTNFGTAHETYKEAVQKDNGIRLQDVNNYYHECYKFDYHDYD